MTTTNIQKKALVEKLIKDSKITIDEALILLEQDYTFTYPDTIITPIINPSPGTVPYTPSTPWTYTNITYCISTSTEN